MVTNAPTFARTVEAAHAQADAVPLPPPEAGPERCLGATDVIERDHPAVVERARALTAGLTSDHDRAAALFDGVRDAIEYDFAPSLRSRADWAASATLERGGGFCQQKAVLFAALARAADLPAAIGFQRIIDHKLIDTRYEHLIPGGLITFHGFNWLWIDGAWRPADATLDAGLCARRGYRRTSMWPEAAARLPLTDRAGRPHFDIVLELGPYADLPDSLSALITQMHAGWDALRDVARRTGATM